MKIRMRTAISGVRDDGQPWPRRGEVIDVPDHEGADLCASGLAAPVRSDKANVETRGAKSAPARPSKPKQTAKPSQRRSTGKGAKR